MAETTNSPSTESPKHGQEFWAIVALGVTALVCFALMAIGLALIFSRGNSTPSINNSTVVNAAAPAVAAPAAVPGTQRPADTGKPQIDRAAAMDRTQPALPGVLPDPRLDGVRRKPALTRSDPPSPPSPPLPKKPTVVFHVRADNASLYPGRKLPMHIPFDESRMAQVAVAQDPATADPNNFAYEPDVAFAESGVRGQALDIQLSQVRKTSMANGLRAPKGFQFLIAKIHLSNQGSQPLVLRVADLEIHDNEGVRYLVNPDMVVGDWPQPSLAPGAEAQVEASFLVASEPPLKELAVQEAPGQVALVPLQAR